MKNDMHTEFFYQDDYHKLSYDNQYRCLVYIAEKRFEMSNLRKNLLKLLSITKSFERHPQHYLADVRNSSTPPERDMVWMNEVFLPKILDKNIRKMALIVPKSVLPQLALDFMAEGIVPNSCEVKFFDSMTEAEKWLKNNDAF